MLIGCWRLTRQHPFQLLSGVRAGPAVPPGSSVVGTTMVVASGVPPSTRFSAWRAAIRPMSRAGCAIVLMVLVLLVVGPLQRLVQGKGE